MDDILTSELKRQCNPGLSDFGSGSLLTLASQCLRCSRERTECTACIDFCAVEGLAVNGRLQPRTTTGCLKCGACVGACPVNAIAGSTQTVQKINRLMLQASLRVSRLAFTCERTAAVLRLEATTSEPHDAEAQLSLIRAAAASEHLLTVPCLGIMTRELWFSTLNEIGASKLEEVLVYLPPEQCALCPVNATGATERQFTEAVTWAEEAAGQQLGIIATAGELPTARLGNVRTYLTSSEEVSRRGAFDGFVAELRRTWDDNSRVGNQALDEVHRQRERKETFQRTQLAYELKHKKPGATRQPIATPLRFILMEALGRNPVRAANVHIAASTTNPALCTLCEHCINACPLHARALIELEPEESIRENPAPSSDAAAAPTMAASEAGAEGAGTAANAKAGGGDAPTVVPAAKQVVANPVYCVGCTACIQACPANACSLTTYPGTFYLVDET